jgi:hypothetical protein
MDELQEGHPGSDCGVVCTTPPRVGGVLISSSSTPSASVAPMERSAFPTQVLRNEEHDS